MPPGFSEFRSALKYFITLVQNRNFTAEAQRAQRNDLRKIPQRSLRLCDEPVFIDGHIDRKGE
jgi:hypothetical protein